MPRPSLCLSDHLSPFFAFSPSDSYSCIAYGWYSKDCVNGWVYTVYTIHDTLPIIISVIFILFIKLFHIVSIWHVNFLRNVNFILKKTPTFYAFRHISASASQSVLSLATFVVFDWNETHDVVVHTSFASYRWEIIVIVAIAIAAAVVVVVIVAFWRFQSQWNWFSLKDVCRDISFFPLLLMNLPLPARSSTHTH